MSRQDSFADCLDILTVKQPPHFFIDKRLVPNVAETSYIQSSSFFDWLGLVLASIGACIPVKYERRSCCWREVKRSSLSVCKAGFEASRMLGSLSRIVVDFDGLSADYVPLKLSYDDVGIFIVVKINKVVRWIPTREGVD